MLENIKTEKDGLETKLRRQQDEISDLKNRYDMSLIWFICIRRRMVANHSYVNQKKRIFSVSFV